MQDTLVADLTRALVAFREAGNRFVSSDPEWPEAARPSDRAELRVLQRLLEAWKDESGALVCFRARSVHSPVFEAADLLVAHPSVGFVVVEVKAHKLTSLTLEEGQLAVKYREAAKAVGRQAERQVSYFMRLLKEARGAARIYLGGSFLVAFPNVWRAAYAESPVSRGGHLAHHLVFAEDLSPERLRALCAGAAQRAAKRSRIRLPAAPKALHLLSRVLGELETIGTIPPREPPNRKAGTLRERIDRIHQSNALTPQQRELALGRYEARPALIRGVAGSGKSLILANNLVATVTRRAPDAPRGRFLVTCFNRSLVPLLRQRIEQAARLYGVDLGGCEVGVSHFEGVLREQVGKRFEIPIPSYRKPAAERYPALLAAVEDALMEHPERADELPEMIYVDEAQDLDPEALRLLHSLCRPHPETGERGFVMAYDDAQNLYGRRRPVWKDLGISLTGGRTRALDESRRTTRPIASFAFNVLLGSALGEEARAGMRGYADVARLADVGGVLELDSGFVVDFAQRSGPLPSVDVLEDAEAEAAHVATAVADLVREQQVRPEEILIQSDETWRTLEPFRAALARLPGAPPQHLIRDSKDELAIRAGSVAFSTIHSAKGYDAPIVFLVNASGFGTGSEDRARFYVGATRAQLRLWVTGHGDPRAGLLREMLEVKRRLPALVRHDAASLA